MVECGVLYSARASTPGALPLPFFTSTLVLSSISYIRALYKQFTRCVALEA